MNYMKCNNIEINALSESKPHHKIRHTGSFTIQSTPEIKIWIYLNL